MLQFVSSNGCVEEVVGEGEGVMKEKSGECLSQQLRQGTGCSWDSVLFPLAISIKNTRLTLCMKAPFGRALFIFNY